jgi:hypothetical protein
MWTLLFIQNLYPLCYMGLPISLVSYNRQASTFYIWMKKSKKSGSKADILWKIQRLLNDYRLPGFLAVVWFGSSATPLSLPLSLSKLDRRYTGDRKTEKERQFADRWSGREVGAKRRIIRPQESLVLYKSVNCLWAFPSKKNPRRFLVQILLNAKA